MKDDTTLHSQTEAYADRVLHVATPDPGEIRIYPPAAGQIIQLDFDIASQTVVLVGSDLRIDLTGGAVLIFEDFAATNIPGSAPMFLMPDGSLIPGDVLVVALSEPPVETAAAEAGAEGGGAGEYDDDMGDLLAGIDKLDGQDPDAYLAAAEPPIEDEQVLVLREEEQPPDDENEAPLAQDDALFANVQIGAYALSNRSNGDFFQVDLGEDGGYTKLFDTEIGMSDITLAPDGLIWGIAHGKEQGVKTQQIVIIDPATETVSYEGIIDGLDDNSPIAGLSFGSDGTLYVVQGDTVYTVSGLDSATPIATELVDLGNALGVADLVTVDGLLYTLSQNGHLLAIDPTIETVTDLGDTQLSPGEYGIAEGMDGTLYMVNFKEVLVLQPNETDFTVIDQYDLDYPTGFGSPWGLAGGVPLGTSLTGAVNVLDNDSDPEGDPLTVVDVDGSPVPDDPEGLTIDGDFGTLTIHQDGSYTYLVSSLETGEDVFTYTIEDGNGGSDTANLVIYVNANLGTDGADTIAANDNGDILFGDQGNDLLISGEGDDILLGGADEDVFGFSAIVDEGADAIRDFDLGEDALRFYDVLDDGDDLLSPAEIQAFAETVTIEADSSLSPDVTLTTDAGTSITIEGINTVGTFDSYDGLSLYSLQSGPDAINVEYSPDTFAS
jgi:VCBS repeat-containing protein